MHPIERLRAVARAQGVDQTPLAREAAMVLGYLADDPPGLVTACRRLLDRHPAAGALWWTCARVLEATDAVAEADRIGRDLDCDLSVDELVLDLPQHATVCIVAGPDIVHELADQRSDLRLVVTGGRGPRGSGGLRRLWGDWGDDESIAVVDNPRSAVSGSDLVVVEALAITDHHMVAPAGAAETSADAAVQGLAVWVVAGVGRRLSPPLFEAMARRLGQPTSSGAMPPPDERGRRRDQARAARL